MDSILASLTDIQLKLLSHPFDSIGILMETVGDTDPPVSVGPCSIDECESYEGGVLPKEYPPLWQVSNFYDYKLKL